MKSSGIGFLGALALLFIGLKLGGVITWSWWWVTAPLWGGIAVIFSMFAVFAGVSGVVLSGAALLDRIHRYKSKKRRKEK